MSLTEIQRAIGRMEQRISNLIRIGRVAEVQDSPPRVKVEYDKDSDGQPVLTKWLRYFEERQGFVQTWNPPKVGEQCAIISPAGTLSMGVVILGLNTTDNPPISADPNIHKIQFDNGSSFILNRASNDWDIYLGGGSATFHGAMFTFNSDVFVNGDIIQVGDFDQEGNITTNGNIIGYMVSDSFGSMVAIRTIYNGHRHGSSPTPDSPM